MVWIEQLPRSWTKLRLKQVVDVKTNRVNEWLSDEYIGLENVESWTGHIVPQKSSFDEYDQETIGITLAGVFDAGDVLFGKLRPYLAKAFLAKSPGVCSTEFLVLRPHRELLAPYLLYLLLTNEFVGLVDSETFGAKMPRASWSSIGNIFIPIPPLSEQSTIVSYLDDETAEIDILIEESETFIRLFSEKRQAIIEHVVTKSVFSNIPLVHSGVEWIGELPEHWDLQRARWLFQEIDDRSTTGEEELLSVSHLTGVTPRSEKDVNMFMAESLEGYKLCQPGDLVINTLWAWMGAMGVAFQIGVVSPSYHVYRPRGIYDPHYIDYLVRTPNFAREVTRYSKGVWSSRLRLYPDEFFKIVLPVPPIDEQREIVEHLNTETAKLDELNNVVQKTIQLLQERRSALISAVVSGKIRIME